jgi:hypothetical protein
MSSALIVIENKEDDNFLALPWPWQDNGEHCLLVSLSPMILYNCGQLYSVCTSISKWIAKLEKSETGGRITVEQMREIHRVVDRAFGLILPLAGADSLATDHADHLGLALLPGATPPTSIQVVTELTLLQRQITLELLKRTFLYVPAPNNAQHGQEKLFGSDVYEKFESARMDIQSAGNAFAVELYTACVFHLMRAAEHGLRAIANDRQVQLTTRSGNPYSLDMGTWEEVLKGLSLELEKVANWERSLGEIRTQGQKFYSSAIEELRAIKDGWRNPTMHARAEYLMEDANQIMAHVKRLMVTLSSRISETERTPAIWTAAQLR